MDFHGSAAVWLFVLGLGTVNWVATEIVVTSVIFKDVRALVDWLGGRVEKRLPRVGEKIRYFLTCALCVGVWIGFIEALAFGGPLQPRASWAAWAAFVANGLLYKAFGHLLLQINAWFHNRIELIKQQAKVAEQDVLLRRNEVRIMGGGSDAPVPERQRT